MTHNFFHIFEIAATIERLNAGYAVLMSRLSFMEWYELSYHMTLQFENGKAYAAVLSVPEFEMSASEQNATQVADLEFEDSRNHMYENGSLQR